LIVQERDPTFSVLTSTSLHAPSFPHTWDSYKARLVLDYVARRNIVYRVLCYNAHMIKMIQINCQEYGESQFLQDRNSLVIAKF